MYLKKLLSLGLYDRRILECKEYEMRKVLPRLLDLPIS